MNDSVDDKPAQALPAINRGNRIVPSAKASSVWSQIVGCTAFLSRGGEVRGDTRTYTQSPPLRLSVIVELLSGGGIECLPEEVYGYRGFIDATMGQR